MKKIVCLLVILCAMISSAAAAGPRFDHMRTVLVVPPAQQTAPAQYMMQRLIEPFRIPYWDRLQPEERSTEGTISRESMRSLAQKYNADIVVTPVVHRWYWRQYTLFFRNDDELITECAYNLAVYAYDAKTDTLKRYSSRGWDRDSASILNDPYEILIPAMDEIMEKLPYKRIPTDTGFTGNTESVLPTKTTDGGATIVTATTPIAI